MADQASADQFVGEAVEPVEGTFDTAAMSRGEPGLPGRFRWRGREHEVAAVLDRWKTSSGCRSGAAELYLRKHWYRLQTTDGLELQVYFERQARRGQSGKQRWWCYTVSGAEAAR